ncbi:hypothetical protein HORIV_10260 [Vreelandella olivaria]|uniref:Uncharacterized protein n=1 Tax=Vreelandella olivaria TaxID=390919 RepID=A0ABM7GDM0_9GAMM|nr:hypothetical protein HORIV_10260 [Halomonas olivaria]
MGPFVESEDEVSENDHSEPESNQSLFERFKMSRLNKEEQDILDAFDAG